MLHSRQGLPRNIVPGIEIEGGEVAYGCHYRPVLIEFSIRAFRVKRIIDICASPGRELANLNNDISIDICMYRVSPSIVVHHDVSLVDVSPTRG